MTQIELEYNNYFIFSAKITIATMIIPIVVGIINKDKLNKPIKVFLWYCIITFVLNIFEQVFIWTTMHYRDLMNPFLKKFDIKSTSFLQIFYYLKNFTLLGYFFYLIIKPKKLANYIKYTSIGLVILSIVNYVFVEGYNSFGVFNPTIDAIYCFVIPLIYMWYLYNTDTVVPINKNPFFWINVGLILTALIGLYLFFTQDKLEKTDLLLFFKIAMVKNLIMIIEQILEAIGFYYARYTKFLPPYSEEKI